MWRMNSCLCLAGGVFRPSLCLLAIADMSTMVCKYRKVPRDYFMHCDTAFEFAQYFNIAF